jgi:hypothetical protein
MERRWLLSLPVCAAVLLLAGCDSFSLTDLLGLPGESDLTLTAAATTAQRNADVALTVSGGTAPYTYSVEAEELYEKTKDSGIGGVYNQTYTSGGAIGRMKVTVTDAKGESASVYVAVVPPTPSLSVNRSGDKKSATISFGGYSAKDAIDKFRLQRAASGYEFTTINEPSSGSTAYTDNTLDAATTYTYRLYVISGSFASLPSEAVSVP